MSLDLDALTALERVASPAPWSANRPSAGEGWTIDTGEAVSHIAAEVQPCDDHPDRDEADADFIVAMRNNLPALLSALTATRAELGRANRELNERRAHECVPTQHAYDRACAALWKHRGRADALAAAVSEVATVAEQVGYSVPETAHVKSALLGLATKLRDALRVDEAALRELPRPADAVTSGCVDGGSKTTPEATRATVPGSSRAESKTRCDTCGDHLDVRHRRDCPEARR